MYQHPESNSDNSKMAIEKKRFIKDKAPVYQVNYKNILYLNCWPIVISKTLTKFIAFIATNCLYTMDHTTLP